MGRAFTNLRYIRVYLNVHFLALITRRCSWRVPLWCAPEALFYATFFRFFIWGLEQNEPWCFIAAHFNQSKQDITYVMKLLFRTTIIFQLLLKKVEIEHYCLMLHLTKYILSVASESNFCRQKCETEMFY